MFVKTILIGNMFEILEHFTYLFLQICFLMKKNGTILFTSAFHFLSNLLAQHFLLWNLELFFLPRYFLIKKFGTILFAYASHFKEYSQILFTEVSTIRDFNFLPTV